MCGILAVIGSTLPPEEIKALVLQLSKRQRHRGPDWSGIWNNQIGSVFMAHERLAIVDPSSGSQPIETDKSVCIVNGEIYNHLDIWDKWFPSYKETTSSDCLIIPHLLGLSERHYNDMEMCPELDGMWSFVVARKYGETVRAESNARHEIQRFVIGRDHIGICPLYIGYGVDGSIWIASEMKTIHDQVSQIEIFEPGHLAEIFLYQNRIPEIRHISRWYSPDWYRLDYIGNKELDLTLIRNTLIKSTIKRLMSDVPFGVLLSGGLDSSIIASIVCRHGHESSNCDYLGKKIHSFCIGLNDAPDLKAAREVAEFLGTKHHEINFTVEEALNSIRDVIWHIETYDQTTVRASVPLYLLSRKIKALGIKMVLSGEGADEIFGGYLYSTMHLQN